MGIGEPCCLCHVYFLYIYHADRPVVADIPYFAFMADSEEKTGTKFALGRGCAKITARDDLYGNWFFQSGQGHF